MINLRAYDKKDYPIICEWWQAHGLELMPEWILPAGLIADNEEYDIAACWLYMDRSTPFCWMNWFVVNPLATGKEKVAAYESLLKGLEDYAKSENYTFMFAFHETTSLAKLALKNGFKMNHEIMASLYKSLKPIGKGN